MPRSASLSRQLRAGLAAVALAVGLTPASSASAGDIAVVVNPAVKVDELSFADLRKILLGDRQFWASGQQVNLIVRAGASPERTVMLEKIYEMNESQFRQYWVAKVFRAEATAAPKAVSSAESAIELVGSLPGGITLVDSADVPAGLKQLKIDGLKPGDKGYPLK